jgi:hypothetical protein
MSVMAHVEVIFGQRGSVSGWNAVQARMHASSKGGSRSDF